MTDKNVAIEGQLDFANIRTYPVRERTNLVTIDNMGKPGVDLVKEWGDSDFDELIERIAQARINGRPVIWSMGAHVIKNGLSRYLIDLVKRGLITHISGNGAGSIHDFELAFNGGTSEDVPTAIEDGSFGMWEETGRWMNEALQKGAKKGMGYGESLAAYIDEYPERFPYKDDCVLYQAYKNGVHATYHIALGTDIIHQHPIVDFAAIGATSGVDFHKICYSVSRLDGGVFLNFGSGVIGPEVFLKALSISRNLGYPTFKITTANFDLVNLGDYRSKIGYSDPNYYYRPRKNIVNRPTSVGGKGWHFCGDHKETIPNLHKKLVTRLPEARKGIE
jgi:Deoxyhypusine synthase